VQLPGNRRSAGSGYFPISLNPSGIEFRNNYQLESPSSVIFVEAIGASSCRLSNGVFLRVKALVVMGDVSFLLTAKALPRIYLKMQKLSIKKISKKTAPDQYGILNLTQTLFLIRRTQLPNAVFSGFFTLATIYQLLPVLLH